MAKSDSEKVLIVFMLKHTLSPERSLKALWSLLAITRGMSVGTVEGKYLICLGLLTSEEMQWYKMVK